MKKVVALTISAVLGSSVACTQESTFQNLDANSDGMINPEEATSVPGLSEVFSDADANQDGLLSREEFQTTQ